MTTNEETTLNIDLLRQAVTWAEREDALTAAEKGGGGPVKWDQSIWMEGEVGRRVRRDADGTKYRQLNVSCGSACCIAGNICMLVGDAFVIGDGFVEPGETVDVSYVMPKGSREVEYIADRAQDLLGIDFDDADRLFSGNNNIEDVRDAASRIAERHGLTL